MRKKCKQKVCLTVASFLIPIVLFLCAWSCIRHGEEIEIDWRQATLERYFDLLPKLKNDQARRQILETISLLMHYKQGGDINHQNKDGRTLVAMAALNNDVELVQRLCSLDVLADVNCADALGQTPLMLACRNNYEEVAFTLLHCGALVDMQNHMGDTALHIACVHRNQKLIDALMRSGSQLTIVNKQGVTVSDLLSSSVSSVEK